MYLIYTLSYNNVVFYVGLTDSPKSRYIQHINGGTPSTEKYIMSRVCKWDYPEFNIVKYSVKYHVAASHEEKVINGFAKLGIKLLNTAFNPPGNRITNVKRGYVKSSFQNKPGYLNPVIETINKYK